MANLLAFNRFDALPTRNFQAGRFEGAERLAAEDLGPARRIARNSCAACTIGCEHIYAAGAGRAASGWSTSRSSRSGRSAASTTRPPCCGAAGPATTRGSTRSAPARRSPS